MPEGNIEMFKEKFNKSIRFKFLSIISVILFVSTLVLSLVVAVNEGRVLNNSLMTTGQSFASYIAKLGRDPLLMKDNIQLDAIVNDANKDEDIAYAIVRDGKAPPSRVNLRALTIVCRDLTLFFQGRQEIACFKTLSTLSKRKSPL